jgi:hypothetical protein
MIALWVADIGLVSSSLCWLIRIIIFWLIAALLIFIPVSHSFMVLDNIENGMCSSSGGDSAWKMTIYRNFLEWAIEYFKI